MPYKNVVKRFGTDTFYHVYARGLNKMTIYKDDSDYTFFLYLLKKYLTKDFVETKIVYGLEIDIPVNSVYGQVELNVYSLMPNHFHLLLFNLEEKGKTKLMQRVLSTYSNYFNKKYGRQGTLIQGNYRAVPILSERQLVTAGIYIHINALKDKLVKKISDYPYNSYKYYWGGKTSEWLVVNDAIKKSTNYKNFNSYLKDEDIEDYGDDVV